MTEQSNDPIDRQIDHQISQGLSRRSLLKGSVGLVIGLSINPFASRRALAASTATSSESAAFAPNAFVRVAPDGIVTVMVKHIEFGQGPLTGLTTLVAEEMDADWSQMRGELAPANAELYANLNFGKLQGTGGSSSIANSYEQMRRAGATAKALLVQAAANQWQVPVDQISVSKGVISHAASGKTAGFGEFAAAAAALPAPTDVSLKSATDFQLIGKNNSTKRLDVPAKTDGSAIFTLDLHEPDMLTVVVAHPPRFGAKAVSVDSKAALAVKGVVAVKTISSGVAVYATSSWPAIKARKLLKIKWDNSGVETRSSDEILNSFQQIAQKQGQVAAEHGNVATAMSSVDHNVQAEYSFPFLAHAPMEPLDGVLRWDQQGVYVKMGSQIPTLDQGAIGKVFGFTPDKVQIDTLLAGGSFGRRAQPDAHFAVELAEVAKAIGPKHPVKLMWTREDDISGGYYRPLVVHRLSGGIKDGKIVAWSNTVVGQSIVRGTPMGPPAGKIDEQLVEGATELPYAIDNFRCDVHEEKVGVPTLWWRSVGATHTGYAVECFVDQLLTTAEQDPVKGRLAMMTEDPRYVGVLKAVADLANWTGSQASNGRARGVAVVKSFGTYVAQIAEVSVNEQGEPQVHQVWCAVDCGQVVNPDIVKAQMEGGIGYGIGHILFGSVDMQDGKIVQQNFDQYRSLRIHEMPEVHVVLVDSTAKPSGVGEPGLPPIGPAIANAMARLGQPRPVKLPMVQSVFAYTSAAQDSQSAAVQMTQESQA